MTWRAAGHLQTLPTVVPEHENRTLRTPWLVGGQAEKKALRPHLPLLDPPQGCQVAAKCSPFFVSMPFQGPGREPWGGGDDQGGRMCLEMQKTPAESLVAPLGLAGILMHQEG